MSLKRRRVVSSDEDYNDLNVPFDLDAKLMQTDLHMKSSVTPKYPACRKQTSIADIPDDPFLVILSYCSDSEDGLQRIKFAFKMLCVKDYERKGSFGCPSYSYQSFQIFSDFLKISMSMLALSSHS